MAQRTLILVPDTIDQTGGGAAFNNVERLRTIDGASSNALISAGGSSQTVRLKGLRSPELAALPASIQPTILGISVSIFRAASAASAIQDLTVQQANGAGTGFGSNLATAGVYWPLTSLSAGLITPVAAEYGGGAGVWTTLPTLYQLRTGDYSLLVAAQNSSGSLATAMMDGFVVAALVDWPDADSVAATPAAGGGLQDPSLVPLSTGIDLAEAAAYRRGQLPGKLAALAEIGYWSRDNGAAGLLTVCNNWLSGGYRTGPTDALPSTLFRPLILGWSVRQSLLSPQQLQAGGAEAEGQLTLANAEYSLDHFLADYVIGYPATIRLGLSDTPYGDLDLVFDGAVKGFELQSAAGTATFTLQGLYRLFNASVAPLRDTGAGNATMTDSVWPVALGECNNVRPPLTADKVYRAHSDTRLKSVNARRRKNVAEVATPTIDLNKGTLTYSAADTDELTLDLSGAEPRNAIKNSRRWTQAGWTFNNCVPSDLTPGLDGTGIGTHLVVTGASATATWTALETISGAYLSSCTSLMIRRTAGSGRVKVAGGGEVVVDTEISVPFRTIASPTGSGSELQFGFPGGAGDEFDIDYAMCGPGAVKPPWPIAATTIVTTLYPSTLVELVKYLMTARCGLVPFDQGFDMTSLARVASQATAVMGAYVDGEQTVLEVLSRFLDSTLCFLTTDRRGRVRLGQIGFPEDVPTVTLRAGRPIIEATQLARTPPRGVRVNFSPNGWVQAAAGTDPELAARPYQTRYGENPDLALQAGDTADQVMEVNTALTAGADASALVDRILKTFAPDTKLLRLTCHMSAAAVWPGDTAAVSVAPFTHGRSDAPIARRMLVLSREIREPEARVELTVMG